MTLARHSVAGRINLEAAGEKISDGSAMRIALEPSLAQKFHYSVDLNRPFKEQGAVSEFYEPYLYLNRTVLNKHDVTLDSAQRALKEWLMKQPGIQQVFTREEIADGFDRRNRLGEMVARSFRPERSGYLHVVLKPKWIFSDSPAGTTYGRPQDDDTHVMLLAFGPRIAPGRYREPVTPLSIAKTIAVLYGLRACADDVPPLKLQD